MQNLLAATGGTVALIFGPAIDGSSTACLAGLQLIRINSQASSSDAGSDDDSIVLRDPDGRIARRSGRHSGDVVIVRPDGYIGFIGNLSRVPAPAAGGVQCTSNDDRNQSSEARSHVTELHAYRHTWLLKIGGVTRQRFLPEVTRRHRTPTLAAVSLVTIGGIESRA